MKENQFAKLVGQAKTDSYSMNALLQMMQPLIIKYSKKIYLMEFEDAIQELSLAIIEAVHRIASYKSDGQCLTYITNAVKFKYIHLCKNTILKNNMENTSNHFETQISFNHPFEDVETICDWKCKKKSLSSSQQLILEYIIAGFSDKEIAKKMGYSRQYVNRIKKKFEVL